MRQIIKSQICMLRCAACALTPRAPDGCRAAYSCNHQSLGQQHVIEGCNLAPHSCIKQLRIDRLRGVLALHKDVAAGRSLLMMCRWPEEYLERAREEIAREGELRKMAQEQKIRTGRLQPCGITADHAATGRNVQRMQPWAQDSVAPCR